MKTDPYGWAAKEMANCIGPGPGFTAVLPKERYNISDVAFQGFCKRYSVIKRFQNSIVNLYKSAINWNDIILLQILEGHLPSELRQLQRRLVMSGRLNLTPKFFRTDEAAIGKIIEVQCPGSMWGEYALLERYLLHFLQTPATGRFSGTIARRFAEALKKTMNKSPIVNHLLDNASIPYSMRFFVELSRREGGIEYWGHDRRVKIKDCNFIRSHSYFGLISENLFSVRLQEAFRGKVEFDYPPISTFDQKAIMALPFHKKYGQYFSDEERNIFPFTNIIMDGKITLSDGKRVEFQDFMERGQSQRDYFVKYAGLDTSRNWGSLAVKNMRKQSKRQLEQLFKRIERDTRSNQFWIIQPSISHNEEIGAVTVAGEVVELPGHMKFSGFYGPGGLLGIGLMHRNFHKVHGANDTVITIV